MAPFSQADLAVFTTPGLDERMQAIREGIHPKLGDLAEALAEPLSQKAGEPLYSHVAKHARRSVNPPALTWVAFGPGKRGYKKSPYVGIAISRFGIHPQVVAKPETWQMDRPAMADRLDARRPRLRLADLQDWDLREAPSEQSADDRFWDRCLHRMRLKTGGLDLGRTLPPEQSDPPNLLEALDDFVTLYRILRGLA